MKKSDVIAHFGSVKEVAKALKILPSAVSQWPPLVPEKRCVRLERLTNGKLKYDFSLYEKKSG